MIHWTTILFVIINGLLIWGWVEVLLGEKHRGLYSGIGDMFQFIAGGIMFLLTLVFYGIWGGIFWW